MALAVKLSPRVLSKAYEQNGGRFIFRRRFTYKDFSSGSSPANNDTIVFPGGCIMRSIAISLITPFSGGSVSAATLSAGTTSSSTAYLGATNVFTGAASSGAVTFGAGASLNTFMGANATPTALGTVRLALATTTDTPDHLTAGVVDVFIEFAPYDVRTS